MMLGKTTKVRFPAALAKAFGLLAMAGAGLAAFRLGAVEPWETALSRMPLGANVTQLDRTNCVPLMLRAFQSNDVVKALIFMPGATDEFYMFRRAKATLTNSEPTLLQALVALTNQTLIHACFQPPFLLLHSDEDPLDLQIHIKYAPPLEKFKRLPFAPHALFIDDDWNVMQPALKKALKVEAAAFAGKTTCTLQRRWDLIAPRTEVIFEGDVRARAVPTFTGWPR